MFQLIAKERDEYGTFFRFWTHYDLRSDCASSLQLTYLCRSNDEEEGMARPDFEAYSPRQLIDGFTLRLIGTAEFVEVWLLFLGP